MKQRLLSVLYEKARREGKIDQFLHNFDYLCGFRIWQLQFVLPDVLLLRFVKQGVSFHKPVEDDGDLS